MKVERETGERVNQPPPDRDERELAVLNELAREDEARVAFQGLKRRLGLHQQQLTRVLRRLEEDQLVERRPEGYGLTEAGFAQLRPSGQADYRCAEWPLAQALLPPSTSLDDLQTQLSGRWFRGLHWYGEASGPGEATLLWLTDPDQETLRLRITPTTITVTVEGRCCAEPSDQAFLGAHTLLAALSDAFPDQAGTAAS